MQELEDLILRLNTDKYQAVSVYDLKSGEYIYKNVTHDQIISDYGSAEDFFEKINADDYTRLMIYPRRRNGKNAFKVDGSTFEINIQPEPKKEKLHFTPEPRAKKKKKKKLSSGLFGLGAVEIMDLKLQANDKNRFETENRELKEQNKRLEEKVAELKEEQLQKKYTKETNDGLYSLVEKGLSTLPVVLKNFNIGNAGAVANVAGMAGAEKDFSHLSEVKQSLIKAIENEDEEMVTLLSVIYQNIISADADNHFASDLQKLLYTHEIIEE